MKTKKKQPAQRKPAKEPTVLMANNRGQKMHLRGSMTIRDLVALGMTRIRLVPAGTPLEDGEWKNVSTTYAPAK